ncbi:uncharacterized protein FIBRA_06906 [Fibroporia radiculosa]|uniref:F-box domain-containing protein n=1 Tax=Fibroporia radiculosa TaxID=599839 RepID=J4GCU8_9APHY|nr:uncharacterized protein FIBRA_06906 [Fibroporia radiculosa]CCM04718.1 predicted protein [Fibroporia radiculosa]
MAASQLGLTLSHLLDRPAWDLPERDGPHSEDPFHVADKLTDLDSSLALLQRYRNSLRPIHRIASDILLLIFLEIQDDDDSPLHSTFGCNNWVRLAHVCHRWRSIAFACPLLWTRISTRYPEAVLACLSNSADAPLSLFVSVGVSTETMAYVIGATMPHAGRIRHLYLPSTFENTDLRQTLAPILQSPMPTLETLHVYKVAMDSDCFPLPRLFAGQATQLTTLKLCYTFPESDSVSFANVRRLLIRGKKRKPITIELPRLFEILEACPNLEELRTVKASFTESEDDERPLRRLRLEHLRVLDLTRCSPHVVADIFRHLIIPECAIRFYTWLERAADFTFRFGIPELLDESSHLREITKLHVEYTSASDLITIQGMTRTAPFHIVASIPSGSDMGEMSTIAGHLLLSIVRTLDLSCLEEFIIAESYYHRVHLGFTRRGWAEVFERMPQLKTLHIRIDSMNDAGFSRSILSALSTVKEITGNLHCPLLETITMVNDKTWSSLQCYLLAVERAKRGHPLKKVSMRLPYYENFEDIVDTDLPAMRQVIESVDLDPPSIDRPAFPDLTW